MNIRRFKAFFLGLLLVVTAHTSISFVHAQSEVERLQSEISTKNNRLSEIEKEIAQYESSLKVVGTEKSTLQKAISQLELERKKVQADIKYTENKISTTDLEINKLILEITVAQNSIVQNENSISAILRKIQIADREPFVEVFLRKKNVSDFWNAIQDLQTVKNKMSERIISLSQQKTELVGKKNTSTVKRENLIDLKSQYNDQQSILTNNTVSKTDLLSATKSKEKEYQAMLKTRKEAKEKLDAEVQDIESQLKFILDPTTIPSAGSAVFRWPIANPYITQYFGYTKFALQSGAYKNHMHNGVDFGAAIGTKIFAPLTGKVRMTGNTDAVPGCYSWGKWALIDHPNGLSSLFAHMSQVAVTPGQSLATGDIVGYVGRTGYSTGPHLHFTVYVSKGVEVKQFNQFKAVTGCGAALSPFAAIEAYLDPLDYLPSYKKQ